MKQEITFMKQEIKLSGGLSITLDDNQKKELLEQITYPKDVKELIKQELLVMLERHKSNVRFLDSNNNKSKYPTSRFQILDEQNKWLFEIGYSKLTDHFYVSYRVFMYFYEQYGVGRNLFTSIVLGLIKEHMNFYCNYVSIADPNS